MICKQCLSYHIYIVHCRLSKVRSSLSDISHGFPTQENGEWYQFWRPGRLQQSLGVWWRGGDLSRPGRLLHPQTGGWLRDSRRLVVDTAVTSLSTSDHQSCLPEGVEKLSSEGCGCWGSQHGTERRFHQDLQRRAERGVNLTVPQGITFPSSSVTASWRGPTGP